jgi:hypothetical protein
MKMEFDCEVIRTLDKATLMSRETEITLNLEIGENDYELIVPVTYDEIRNIKPKQKARLIIEL